MPYNIPEEAWFEVCQAEAIILQQRGIPRCLCCLTDMIKESEYTWKPNCPCMSKDLRLSRG